MALSSHYIEQLRPAAEELKLLILDPLHTTPEKFKNADLFLRLGLPSTLICHENGAYRKRSWNRRNLETLAFRFRVDGKHFENEAFRNAISLTEFSFKHISKMINDCCVFKFLRRSVGEALTIFSLSQHGKI